MLRLKFERTNRGISQQRLAIAAALVQPAVSLIECGRLLPTSEELRRLGLALNVPPNELLEDVAVQGPTR